MMFVFSIDAKQTPKQLGSEPSSGESPVFHDLTTGDVFIVDFEVTDGYFNPRTGLKALFWASLLNIDFLAKRCICTILKIHLN